MQTQKFSNDALKCILEYLQPKDVARMAAVCKQCFVIFRNEAVWQKLWQRNMWNNYSAPISNLRNNSQTYFEQYKSDLNSTYKNKNNNFCRFNYIASWRK